MGSRNVRCKLTENNEPQTAVRLLIVDDHPVIRDGLRAMLLHSKVEIIGEAENGLDAVERARELKPDVILMDVRMPDMDGLAATRLIKEENSSIAVVILTSFESNDYLHEAVDAGAAGYLQKGLERSKLLSAIEDVVSGASLFDPAELVCLLRGTNKDDDPAVTAIESMTDQEEMVVGLISAGKTNGEIAESLGFSIGTIKTIVQSIISKFDASDRTQAAVAAARAGWLPADAKDES